MIRMSLKGLSACPVRGKRKQLFTREVKCLIKIWKMCDFDSAYPVLWGVPCNGLQVLWADHSQHLWVKMLHFIQLIKVPEGAVKSVKQKEMHINSLHWIGKRELCPFHLPSSSVFYTVRENERTGWESTSPFSSFCKWGPNPPSNPAFISNLQQH